MSDNLDAFEQELLQAYEDGKLQSEELSPGRMAEFKAAAQSTFLYDQPVEVCLSKADLMHIQLRAAQEGVPFQTLIASVLHKFVNGQLLEKRLGGPV
jgi:predicted DNA binding CopG/RHH family protein